MALGLGLGIQFYRRFGAGIDAQAQVHYNRVIADGGVVPSGLSGVNAFFSAVKAIYGTSDINTAISAAYDAHYLGYKLGAGSGTTLGQAAQKLYAPKGIFGGIGTGSAFWEGVGVTGNYVQTPSAAINQITGDIEIVARISISDEAGEKTIISKRSGANASYVLSSTSKLLRFRINTTTYDSNASHTFAVNEVYWAKVTRQQSNGEIKFFTSLNGTTWTQLGTTIVGITDSIAVNSVPVIVGVLGDLNSFSMKGNIYRATIANSIGGTPVVDFNANQYTGANTWTSTTSEVWTVNSTGAGLADVVQTTAASQPLLLAHTGENYWWGSGVSGNYCSTPNAAANQITGDIEIIAKVSFKNVASFQDIVSKFNGSTGFLFNQTNLGRLEFYSTISPSGSIDAISSVGHGFSANTIFWVKVTRSSSSGEVKFYTSTDGTTYTQLGTTITATAGNLRLGTAQVEIGADQNGTNNRTLGSFYRATISNSIGGTPVVDFNPASYNPSVSQTQWTSATGEVWTLNVGTATSGYKGAVITKSIVMSDGVDDRMQAATLNINTTAVSLYSAFRKYNNTAGAAVIELGTDYSTTNGFGLYLNSLGAAAEAFGIFGNVFNARVYNSNSLLLKLSTAIGDTSIPDPETQYFINNSAQSVFATFSAANNTTGINQTGLNVFGKSGGTSLSNLNMNTLIISNTNNNSTIRTSMYDALKGFNNNSF